ncbi:MAG: hypothetical protein K1X81_10070 [Bacteroidia bacterium]|nr:hypothetical protein [Bacteroidia bacterium]
MSERYRFYGKENFYSKTSTYLGNVSARVAKQARVGNPDGEAADDAEKIIKTPRKRK